MIIKDSWNPCEAISDHLVHEKLQDPSRDLRLHNRIEEDEDNQLLLVDDMQYDGHGFHATGTGPWSSRYLPGITIMERFMQPLDDLLGRTPAPPQSIKSISDAMAEGVLLFDVPDGPHLENRQRHRTLFSTCGVDILWFGSAREVFHGIGGAVVGEMISSVVPTVLY